MEPLWIIGNPDNRRVIDFRGAAAGVGIPTEVISHIDLLTGRHDLSMIPAGADVRLESTGEHPGVADALLARGYDEHDPACSWTADQRADPRQLLSPAQEHAGFIDYLRWLGDRDDLCWWTPPATVAELFDKRATHARWSEEGIPVPEALEPVPDRAALLEVMHARGWPQVVMKSAFGSSASCLAVISPRRTMTTLRRTQHGWFNTLRMQRVVDDEHQDAVFAFIAGQRPHFERLVPKARLERAFFDCRVLTIAGEPKFVVVRQAHHPITNLHLGGWRGSVDTLRASMPNEAWEAAMDSCRRVAACHDAFHLGIDLMFEPDFAHRIIEANAFGDLLPRLERDGLDVYAYEVRQRGL